MDYLEAWFGLWRKEQKASLERITTNIRIVLLLLPMAFVEAFINTILLIILTPFIFSRGLDSFINRINILYKTANYEEISKSLAVGKWPGRLSKADKISRDFSIKEDEITIGFIAKASPFIIGVLTTLVTLFVPKKI